MLYFHDMVCLSPFDYRGTAPADAPPQFLPLAGTRLNVKEPPYPGIPPNVMRRMGKCVRMCVGASLPLIGQNEIDGIIIGTANGGMEDCIKFLNQIIEYDEGKLTPGHFVQSTGNGPAAQLALVTRNKKYNITHVHRGLAFEQALLDAELLLREQPDLSFLLGAVDEISAYNFNIDRLAGWFRGSSASNLNLFSPPARGTIAGEGAVTMIVSGTETGARAVLRDMQTMHTADYDLVKKTMQAFLKRNEVASGEDLLLISGENGDERFEEINVLAESLLPESTPVLRYKHLTGEYATATSFAVWLATRLFSGYTPSPVMVKKGVPDSTVRRILICNAYRGLQHAFLLLEKP